MVLLNTICIKYGSKSWFIMLFEGSLLQWQAQCFLSEDWQVFCSANFIPRLIDTNVILSNWQYGIMNLRSQKVYNAMKFNRSVDCWTKPTKWVLIWFNKFTKKCNHCTRNAPHLKRKIWWEVGYLSLFISCDPEKQTNIFSFYFPQIFKNSKFMKYKTRHYFS